MLLADYQPRPALVTKTTVITKPRFPVIDTHNHLGEPFGIDLSARIGELGRQPYSARRFFIDYADRILFGTDAPPGPDTYRNAQHVLTATALRP